MQGNRAIDILIADDDAEDLELIEEAILSFEPNAQLHMVNDGKAAVDYLATLQDHNLPALIILDYNMPQLKGSEVLLHLGTQSRYNAVPKVILSTSNTEIYIDECKRQGAAGYFVKPNTQRELDLMAEEMRSEERRVGKKCGRRCR